MPQIRKDELAKGFRGDRIDSSIQSVKDGVWENSSIVSMMSHEFVEYLGGAVHTRTAVNRYACIEFPPGAICTAMGQFWKPGSWINGRIEMEIMFALNNPGAAQDVILRKKVWGHQLSAPNALTTLINDETTPISMNGYSSGDMGISTKILSTVNVTDPMDVISMQLMRNTPGYPADTWPNDFYLVGVRFVYHPQGKQ